MAEKLKKNKNLSDKNYKEYGPQFCGVNQTSGYRGNAKGVATIVLYNGGFV